MRLFIGFKVFNIPEIMKKVKRYFKARTDEKIAKDQDIGESMDLDSTNIKQIIIIGFLFKILKLIMIIFNISYFLGFFWYISCEIKRDLHAAAVEHIRNLQENNETLVPIDSVHKRLLTDIGAMTLGFIDYYHLDEGSDNSTLVTLTYFAFTSLSTVGFGDLAPRSDLERVVGAIILLLGVAIFSAIMGIFLNILDQYKQLEADLDDGDNLSKFFGLMTQMNNGIPLEIGLQKRIEEHFAYKWEYDRNQAIDKDTELALMEQLPDFVVNKIFSEFLYEEFLRQFRETWRIPKPQQPHSRQHAQLYYGWDDQKYRHFMIEVLRNLAPRFENKGSILINELEEVLEVLFMSQGTVDIGFEINRKPKFAIRF